MALGMTRDEYWNGDIFLPLDYIEADLQRRKMDNWRGWLFGAYVCDAVSVALSNGFSKSGQEKAKYPAEPYEIFPEKERQEQKEIQNAEMYMELFVKAGENWGKKNEAIKG